MEKKNYFEIFQNLQNLRKEILNEICELVSEGHTHYFSDKFYVYDADWQYLNVGICQAVNVWDNGTVTFIIHNETTNKTEAVFSDALDTYTIESFIDVVMHLEKDIRQQKILHLRECECALAKAKEDWENSPLYIEDWEFSDK